MGKKILYIHHCGGLAGAPKSLSILLDCLNLEKYEPSLLLIFKGPAIDYFKNKNLQIYYNKLINPFHGSTVTGDSYRNLIRDIIKSPFTFLASKYSIKKLKPEIIHLNSSCLCIVALAAKLTDNKIKIICHIREPLRNNLSGKIIRYLCYKYVDHFIAIDSYSASTMKTKNNMSIIHNSVDLNVYNDKLSSNILRTELNIPNSDIIFLYLARVVDTNGTKELIKLGKEAIIKNKHFHFVIAGFVFDNLDTYSKECIEICRDTQNIHLLGFRNDVPQIIASSDIMVVPFTEPHFSRAIIEAAAIGKPSIGTNVGGVKELINNGETGYLCNNFEEFLGRCEELGNDAIQRESFGKAASEYAKDNFNIVKTSEKVFEIY